MLVTYLINWSAKNLFKIHKTYCNEYLEKINDFTENVKILSIAKFFIS